MFVMRSSAVTLNLEEHSFSCLQVVVVVVAAAMWRRSFHVYVASPLSVSDLGVSSERLSAAGRLPPGHGEKPPLASLADQ